MTVESHSLGQASVRSIGASPSAVEFAVLKSAGPTGFGRPMNRGRSGGFAFQQGRASPARGGISSAAFDKGPWLVWIFELVADGHFQAGLDKLGR